MLISILIKYILKSYIRHCNTGQVVVNLLLFSIWYKFHLNEILTDVLSHVKLVVCLTIHLVHRLAYNGELGGIDFLACYSRFAKQRFLGVDLMQLQRILIFVLIPVVGWGDLTDDDLRGNNVLIIK